MDSRGRGERERESKKVRQVSRGGGSGVEEVWRGVSRKRQKADGGRKVGGLEGKTGPTGLENSPLFLLTLARCLIASYFRIFRVELSIETRERGFVCVLSPTALVLYSLSCLLSLSPFFSLLPSAAPDPFLC